ncbi:MAG: hypothetical protein LKG11_02790 [Bacilli bacterium]|jgi:hypothetical protein|nr:hypothetical protein [Bacilli bacterium]
MLAFPNSYNAVLILFRVKTAADSLGNKAWRLVGSKEVGGSISSISSKEFNIASTTQVKYEFKVSIQCFLYDGSKYAYLPREDKVYQIGRTYLNGQFLELYLSETSIRWEDIIKDGS